MKLCYVTDRKALPGTPEMQMRLLLEKIAGAALAGVDWVQIREKDLEARVLLGLVQEAKQRAWGRCRILVNDRLDVAIAAAADGVHLGELSLRVADAKRFCAAQRSAGEFVVGVSTHSVEALQEAEAGGVADYGIFGPIFATPSKLAYGLPQGVEKLREACRSVSMPVLAIGGISAENARECRSAGAAGIAAIRVFQDSEDLGAVVKALRSQ
jgi:thiamine-phosphate pyrophosphorylase